MYQANKNSSSYLSKAIKLTTLEKAYKKLIFHLLIFLIFADDKVDKGCFVYQELTYHK